MFLNKKLVVCGLAVVTMIFLSARLSGKGGIQAPSNDPIQADSIPAITYSDRSVYIPSSDQRTGDPALGYSYVVEGDYLKSGIPY